MEQHRLQVNSIRECRYVSNDVNRQNSKRMFTKKASERGKYPTALPSERISQFFLITEEAIQHKYLPTLSAESRKTVLLRDSDCMAFFQD